MSEHKRHDIVEVTFPEDLVWRVAYRNFNGLVSLEASYNDGSSIVSIDQVPVEWLSEKLPDVKEGQVWRDDEDEYFIIQKVHSQSHVTLASQHGDAEVNGMYLKHCELVLDV